MRGISASLVPLAMPLRELLLLTFALGALSNSCPDKDKLPMTRLRKALLEDYDYASRPVCDHKKAVSVGVKMILKHFTFDMHENLITVHNWLPMVWKDEHFTWNPSDYDSIYTIDLSSNEIWTPDISVYNRHDQEGSAAVLTATQCMINYNGVVVCVPPSRQDGLCRADVAKYPFDTQVCTLRYGSWVHTGEQMNFTFQSPAYSLDGFNENSEWKLLKVETGTHKGNYKCCPNSTYPTFTYTFTITRHSGAHVATIFIPALVMAILTLTVLWMDPRNSDRIFMACCNILCHIMYIQFISWELPYNAENTPLIVLYARDALLMSTFALVLSVALKGLTASRTPGPVWVSAVVDTLVKSAPGQAILYNYSAMGTPAAKGREGDEAKIVDDDDIAPVSSSNSNSDWVLFAKVIDRLTFVAILIAYFCMFIAFVP